MANRERIEKALACFVDPARHDAYFDMYSEDVVFHGYPGVEPGLDSVKRFYSGIWAALPDTEVDALDWMESGDKVALRFVLRGTHRGEFLGVPATGRLIECSGITFLRFENGKCVERWGVMDLLSVLGQMQAP